YTDQFIERNRQLPEGSPERVLDEYLMASRGGGPTEALMDFQARHGISRRQVRAYLKSFLDGYVESIETDFSDHLGGATQSTGKSTWDERLAWRVSGFPSYYNSVRLGLRDRDFAYDVGNLLCQYSGSRCGESWVNGIRLGWWLSSMPSQATGSISRPMSARPEALKI
ncbi:MAG: hypothetical protein AAF202_07875, partial [Pseudomonadota bacterium]